MLQQAKGQVFASKLKMEFEACSYGFRPNKNAHEAVLKAHEYINGWYNHIVDIDMKTFLNKVFQSILMQLVCRKETTI